MLIPGLFIALIALIIGSYTDFRTKEVPDWLNYSLIFTGVFLHLLYSIIFSNWIVFLKGMAGLALAAAIAFPMFYLGQWGGGDSKMLMALGSLIGLDFSYTSFLPSLLVNIFLIGAVYGIVYGAVLAVKHKDHFIEKFRKVLSEKKNIRLRIILIAVCIVLIILSIFLRSVRLPLLLLVFVLVLSFYLWAFVKAVEKAVMYRLAKPSQLTEGDWIAKNVVVKGRKICGPKDLGITKEQINKLKKLNVRNVLVKDGIPFVPSFLISLIFAYFWGNVLFLFIS
jgi:Flp pilus assembly protein protease CpaA